MIFKKLRTIIADIMNVDEKSITEDTRFEEDLSADSLDLAQIVMEIEQEFEIELIEDDLKDIKTVKDAAEAIGEALDEKR